MFRFQGIRRLVNLRKANQQKELVYTVEDSGLTKQQVKAGMKALKALDLLERTEDLTIDDLTRFLYAIGMNPTPDVVGTKLRLMKLQQRQRFTWGELAHLWHSLEADKGHEEEILARAFQFFDKDGNGEISVAELRTTMHELGDLLTEEEIMEFVGITDANNDGVIAYQEFLEILKSQAPGLSMSGERPSQDDVVAGTPGASKRATASLDACNPVVLEIDSSAHPSKTAQQHQQQQHQQQQKEEAGTSGIDSPRLYDRRLPHQEAGTSPSMHRAQPHEGLPGQLSHSNSRTRAPSALDLRPEGEEGPSGQVDSAAATGTEAAGMAATTGGSSSSSRAFDSISDAPAVSSPHGANRLKPLPPHGIRDVV